MDRERLHTAYRFKDKLNSPRGEVWRDQDDIYKHNLDIAGTNLALGAGFSIKIQLKLIILRRNAI